MEKAILQLETVLIKTALKYYSTPAKSKPILIQLSLRLKRFKKLSKT